MAKDRNTDAKRRRETGKRQKADEKRARRLKRKEGPKSLEGSSDENRAPSEL